MIHSSQYLPTILPIYVDETISEIDRVQDLSSTTTLNRTKVEEVGRVGIVDWRKATPTISVTLRQLEYGQMEFWRKLANKASTVQQINWTDFKTSASDLCAYMTDDSGTFLGTLYYPGLRMASLALNIGSPDAMMERNFTLAGEDEYILENANKYVICKKYTIATGGLNKTVTISDPAPAADPDLSGQFLFKVVKVSGGTATLLTHGLDWSYDGAGTLQINGASSAGDSIKVYYSAGSYIGGLTPFSLNDIDASSLSAENVSIYLQSANYVYRLQSVAIDTTFNRFDVKEIGSMTTVARGVRDITNRITLGRILEAYTIEEILRGVAGQSYGKLNPRNFTSNFSLIIKIYAENTKDTFKLGYKFLDVAATSLDGGVTVSDYVRRGVVLEGEEAFVTTNEGSL